MVKKRNIPKNENIIRATIHLYKINVKHKYVPDYELIENKFNLSVETMREIRDVIQS